MQSCIGKLAASIGMDCAHPLVGGYTGRGIIFDTTDVDYALEFDASNPRIILDTRGISAGATIDNAMLTTPLEGSNTTGTNDAGFTQFTKQVSGRILMRGADVSKDLVEPLVSGRYLIILEKRETRLVEELGGIEAIGAIKPARCVDPSTVVRNENENGGAISFTLETTEPYFEVDIMFSSAIGKTNHQWFDQFYEQPASLAAFAEH